MAQLDLSLNLQTEFVLPRKPKLAEVLVDQLQLDSPVRLRRRLAPM